MTCMSVLDGRPNLQIAMVLVIVPIILNSLVWWVQDAFLKGDSHLEQRKQAQTIVELER